jgi:hypothetical protein
VSGVGSDVAVEGGEWTPRGMERWKVEVAASQQRSDALHDCVRLRIGELGLESWLCVYILSCSTWA